MFQTTALTENAVLIEQLNGKSKELEEAIMSNQEMNQAMEDAVKEKEDALAFANTKEKEFVAELNSYQADNDREVNAKLEGFKQRELEKNVAKP